MSQSHGLPGRDPLLVVKEFICAYREGRRREEDIDSIRGELDILRARLEKVRKLYPEYKNLSFGEEVDDLFRVLERRKAKPGGALNSLRRAAGLL